MCHFDMIMAEVLLASLHKEKSVITSQFCRGVCKKIMSITVNIFERFLCVFVLDIRVKTYFYNVFLIFFLWKTDKHFIVKGEDFLKMENIFQNSKSGCLCIFIFCWWNLL